MKGPSRSVTRKADQQHYGRAGWNECDDAVRTQVDYEGHVVVDIAYPPRVVEFVGTDGLLGEFSNAGLLGEFTGCAELISCLFPSV